MSEHSKMVDQTCELLKRLCNYRQLLESSSGNIPSGSQANHTSDVTKQSPRGTQSEYTACQIDKELKSAHKPLGFIRFKHEIPQDHSAFEKNSRTSSYARTIKFLCNFSGMYVWNVK